MAEGRAKLEWDQTSLLWSIAANAARDAKKHPKPFLPSMVHPLRTEDDYKPKAQIADMTMLKKMFDKGA